MKKLLLLYLLSLLFCSVTYSQQPTRESLEAKKKQLSAVQASLAENKKKLEGLEDEIKRLESAMKSQEMVIETLEKQIPSEEEEVAFLESPPRLVIDVRNANTLIVQFDNAQKFVLLHGLAFDDVSNTKIIKYVKTRLAKKSVYIRCANENCSEVYVYLDRHSPSLNAEMVKLGIATAANDARFDLAIFSPANPSQNTPSTATPSYTQSSGSSNSTPGNDVQVRGYYRKGGTYVKPHTRSAPGSKKRP